MYIQVHVCVYMYMYMLKMYFKIGSQVDRTEGFGVLDHVVSWLLI